LPFLFLSWQSPCVGSDIVIPVARIGGNSAELQAANSRLLFERDCDTLLSPAREPFVIETLNA
jgi:hypothetical protein